VVIVLETEEIQIVPLGQTLRISEYRPETIEYFIALCDNATNIRQTESLVDVEQHYRTSQECA